MAGEKKLVKSKEGMNTGFKSAPVTILAEQNVIPGKDGSRSDSATSVSSSGNAVASIKGETYQVPAAEQSVYYQPTNCYGYYYPGYDGTYPEWDDRCYFHAADGSEISYSGMQTDNGSLLYYVPGYNAYATGSLMAVDGQCVGQSPYFPSSGYFQPPYSYSSETMQPHSWNSTVVGDAPAGTAARLAGRKADATSLGPAAPVKPKGLNSVKTNGTVDTKVSGLPLDSKSRLSTASANFSKSTLQIQPLKPLNKVPQFESDYRSPGFVKGCYPMEKFSPFPNQGHGLLPHNGYMYYRPNGRTWAGNERFRLRERFGRNGEFEASSELNRGPRARKAGTPLNSSVEKDQLLTVQRDKYNLQEFRTEYENAKFFVIKSYSEDDIHKSIKYGVWTSTANGNRKLDAAFHEAETRAGEMSKRSPIFLLFSVNGSGQFVGLAEMTGQVDFKKDMNFWQQDKWNGFFPVQWHIIKDIPNVQLRHIILENNDNKPVTNSRDTQEAGSGALDSAPAHFGPLASIKILRFGMFGLLAVEIGFKQGLEMLTIFKSSSPKTSMLDDFNFYEDREKSLHAKRNSKAALSQVEIDRKNEFQQKHLEAAAAAAGVRKVEEASMRDKITSDPKVASLITLTKNLALNPHQVKSVC